MSSTANNTSTQSDLRSKLRCESIRSLAEQGRSSFLVSLANAVIVLIVLHPVGDSILLYSWFGLLVFLTFIRTVMVFSFFRMGEDSDSIEQWRFYYLLFVYATGLCWGGLPLSSLFDETIWTQAFIIFTIAGMSAGALVSLYPLRSAAVPYLAIILFPLIYVLASSNQPSDFGMAVLAGLYLVLLVRSAYTLNESVRKTLRLELENEELFKFLLAARRTDTSKPESKTSPDNLLEDYDI